MKNRISFITLPMIRQDDDFQFLLKRNDGEIVLHALQICANNFLGEADKVDAINEAINVMTGK